jgi:hypothetical protein
VSRRRLHVRRRRLALGALAFAGLLLALSVGVPDGSVPRASGLQGAGEMVAQTDDSVPATRVTMFGSSPLEAPEEAWGVGQRGGGSVLVRYLPESAGQGGWSLGSPFLDSKGAPLTGFAMDQPEAYREATPSPLAGQMTPRGSGALGGTVGSGSSARQVLLVRKPGGAFQETTPVPSGEEGLAEGEQLFGVNRAPMIAALDEEGGGTGALVAPVSNHSLDTGVLHWDGSKWTREPIEIPAKSSEQFEVLALGASSPGNAWLLARLSPEYKAGSVALFRRHLGSGIPTWQPVTPKVGGEPGEPIEVDNEVFTIPSGDQAQVMTVTATGLWLDGLRRDVQASTTLFFTPEGESNVGQVAQAWCKIPASAPPGTPACAGELPEALPRNFSRSFAWPGSGSFGERVITGLRDGQSLRFAGGTFTTVLSLGGEAGANFGAAFASAQEGWLGKELLPVHLTQNPSPSKLAPWPVPFRFALTALAPQPGAPVGSLSSQVLAVGDRGEVARYHPGAGWFPETLPGPGGSERATPRLRAVAWPTPKRAFAVGDKGAMWLWRGETGLWEPDPATPLNFRANLLGVAFDPNNSARGYAVGESGALLRYGKSWTQEPEASIPPAARGANFTSIAFAGSEAIVAYRKLVQAGQSQYTGGIIVNNGAGWSEDSSAAAVLGSTQVPWAVAGLPDGGAAFTAKSATQGATVFERTAPGAPWQSVAYPGGFAPGSLTLFRESGALRAVATGGEPDTFSAEEAVAPPPGFPPILVDPYPLVSNPERGVLRQTSSGWSDEEHELNDAKEPPGEYFYYDTPYTPDPVSAVLVDPSGGQGWAVGGIVSNKHALLDTADIYRYPSEGSPPPGAGSAPEKSGSATTFAIGGGAGCAAPCAARAGTRIGPDVWLSSALSEARGISGVQAFLYTGPRVTTGQTAGPPTVAVPYAGEEQRYAQLLAGQEGLPVYPVVSPTDLDLAHSEGAFDAAFPQLQQSASPEGPPPCTPAQGCTGVNYTVESGNVVGIMLDDTVEEEPEPRRQLEWLARELQSAAGAGKAAIVVGSVDLAAEFGQGRRYAREVISTIEAGHASAYFFDAPEQNIRETLTGSPTATPAYGSGTLGYVNVIAEENSGFIGQSGFLLAEVGAAKSATSGRYPVQVKLIPDVGELAIEAEQGTFLQRSQAASFAGLARRPRSGNRAQNKASEPETSPYIEIPSICRGSGCERGIEPYYEFTSSAPEIGAFVQRNINSGELNAVLHNPKGQPIVQPGGHDALFCAFNKGTTTVTLKAGNASFSLPVTIQAGSVRQPCGTTPLHERTASQQAQTNPPPPPIETQVGHETPPPLPVPPPPAAVPASTPAAAHAHPAPVPFFTQPAPASFVPPFVPVPVPTPARPTPPSGTSAITSPVEAPQKEEESEAAPESVSNEAVAYRQSEHEPEAAYVLGVILLAAFAGASLRGRPGRGRRGAVVAPATITSARGQRQISRGDRADDIYG